jgi:acetyl esterase
MSALRRGVVAIDPELRDYLAAVAAAVPPIAAPTPSARRARMEQIARLFPFPADRVARQDHWLTMPGRDIFMRIYRSRSGRLPAILYLHGGGWVAGSVNTHDGICAALANEADAVVVSVQYRLAPENPFPAPNDDAFAALQWLADSAGDLDIDVSRIALAGDSAGAHLALGAAIEARDRGGPPIALQILFYPVVAPDFETASYREHANSTLTRADMMEYWDHYLPADRTRADHRALPLRAPLRGLPSTHVVVAGLDPLHDEGVTLVEELQRHGVDAVLVDEPTLVHGFLRASPFVRRAREALTAAALAAGKALRRAAVAAD